MKNYVSFYKSTKGTKGTKGGSWIRYDTPGPTLGPGNLPRTEHEVARPWDVSRDDGLI
jgi:hypothetical protein